MEIRGFNSSPSICYSLVRQSCDQPICKSDYGAHRVRQYVTKTIELSKPVKSVRHISIIRDKLRTTRSAAKGQLQILKILKDENSQITLNTSIKSTRE
ncbi:unnamed protein product, partial [Nesidiocoris tenuis]